MQPSVQMTFESLGHQRVPDIGGLISKPPPMINALMSGASA
jgi:hypothetical protein